MDYNGVKFYSKTDMSGGYYLRKAEQIFNDFDESLKYNDINQIIELYNTCCYLDEGLYLESWSEYQKKKYNEIAKKFKSSIGKCFSKIDEDNIWDIYYQIDSLYNDDFWKLFENFKIYKRLSGEIFKKLLTHDHVSLYDVLACKSIVNYYGIELTEYLLNDNGSAELLLREYAEAKTNNEKKCYFPKVLGETEKIKIITDYIESDSTNSNYLKLIYETQSTPELPIPDKVKLAAKRMYTKKLNEIFETGVKFSYGAQVSFRNDQDEVVKSGIVNRDICVSYSRDWIKQNQDYPTLLNNFIYLFEYTDTQFRVQHVSKTSQMGIFERTLGVKGKKEYLTGTAFNQLQGLAMLQLISYDRELKDINIHIEDLVEWFFRDYLKGEFEVEGFYIKLPSEDSTYLEKCRTLVSEIDSILKQFKLYVEDGEIDHELLQLSSEHLFFKDIPSLIKTKYIYGNSKEYNTASFYLFSDQSPLYHIKMYDKYNKLPQLLCNENLTREEFDEYQRQGIDWLLENKYLYTDKTGYLKLDLLKVGIIKELFDNEVLCLGYSELFSKQLEELETKGVIMYESSLFSKPEQNYFNYLLNKAEFSNGLDLRNRYLHGTQSNDEKVHEQDYFIFLKIMILIVIKINEEFCLNSELKNL